MINIETGKAFTELLNEEETDKDTHARKMFRFMANEALDHADGDYHISIHYNSEAGRRECKLGGGGNGGSLLFGAYGMIDETCRRTGVEFQEVLEWLRAINDERGKRVRVNYDQE